jgi:acetyl-CoA carboxylase biotin carboxyl carrier protein
VAAEDSPETGQPFDVQLIRQLLKLMSAHDLSEVDLSHGDRRVRLRRGPRGSATSMPSTMPAPVLQATPALAPAPPQPAAAPKAPDRKLIEIKSEAIGTFYAKPNPDAESYVKVGSRITPSTVIGLIEAMKLFNEIQAGVSGTIAEICVENQQAVEFGTVLFRVDPAG